MKQRWEALARKWEETCKASHWGKAPLHQVQKLMAICLPGTFPRQSEDQNYLFVAIMQCHILQSQRNKSQTCRTHSPSASPRQAVNAAVLMCKSERAARAWRLFLLSSSLLSSLHAQRDEKATAGPLSSSQPSPGRYFWTRKRNRGKEGRRGERCRWTKRGEGSHTFRNYLVKTLAQKPDDYRLA